MNELRCLECGLLEDEHHEFFAAKPPKGCVCDPREWANPTRIPSVCRNFKPQNDPDFPCGNCEHDPACHGVQA